MAKTIANFLVGIGLDTKDFDKGAKGVDTSLSGFRSKASLAGGAIAAAFAGASLAAINAGKSSDEFMRKVAKFDTSSRFVYNLGNAFKLLGGDAEDAISTIERAEGVLDALRKGDASALESAGLAQVDVSRLQTSRDGQELLMNLADIMSSPNTQDWQKRSLQETFGLSNEGLALLSKGREGIESAIASVDKYSNNLETAAEAGREYAEALAKVNIQLNDMSQSLAGKILPKFTSLINGFSKLIDDNEKKIGAAGDYIAENIGAAATAGVGLGVYGVANTGAAIASKLGMKGLATVGRGAAMGGVAGAAAGAGSLLWDLKASDIESMTGYDVSKYYRAPSETWADVKGWWRSGVASNADAAASSPAALAARKPSLSEMARSDASVPPPIVVESKLYLNEREIAKTVRKVNAEDTYNAYTEVLTTESR